jgi:HlyD family secretion protein
MIAPIEFNEIQKGLLDQKMSYQNFVTTLLNNQLNIEQILQLIINLEQQEKDRSTNALIKLQQTQQQVIADIENWEQKFILKSPQDGKIIFLKTWAENQDLVTTEPAFIIVSPYQKIIGRISVPLYKSSKIKKNQVVNIKLTNYPFEQYGILKGNIENISEIPFQDNYIVTVNLPQDLKTTYNKHLRFYPEMKGDAQIILKDERLLYKLLYKIRKVQDGI